MAYFKLLQVTALVLAVGCYFAVAKPYSFQNSEVGGDEQERSLDSLGGGHLIRGLDSLGGGNLVRAIYLNERPRGFPRSGRGFDSLTGAAFGTAKRFDSLSGLTFGEEKRNFDEIDRNSFDSYVKKNFDEIDRSGFDRYFQKREASDPEN